MNAGITRHVPNIITFARPVLTLLFICLILESKYIHAISVFAAICMTDVFDGIAARALGACTRFGAYLDVVADLLFVMASLVVLNMKGLAPSWFTAVTALKFLEFAITSSILKRNANHKSAWIFDGLGRFFSALVFITPGVFCFAAMYPVAMEYVEYFLLAPACALAAVSSAIRLVRCCKSKKFMRCFNNEQSDRSRFHCACWKIKRS